MSAGGAGTTTKARQHKANEKETERVKKVLKKIPTSSSNEELVSPEFGGGGGDKR